MAASDTVLAQSLNLIYNYIANITETRKRK